MTRAIFVLFAVLAGVVSLRGQETASIRLVPTSRERTEEARGSGPSFHAVYAEGETAARERGVPLVVRALPPDGAGGIPRPWRARRARRF